MMNRPTIVGYDDSQHSRDALALARWLVFATGTELILADVYPDHLGLGAQARRREAERALAWAPSGVRVSLRTIAARSAHRGLRDVAREAGAALIVIGSTHRGKLGLVEPGSTGEHLLHDAPCAIAVAPAGYAARAKERHGTIAVGYDGSRESRAALDSAIALARTCGASLRVLTIFELVPDLRGRAATQDDLDVLISMRAEHQAHLEEALAAIPEDVESEGVLAEGYATEVLPAWADVDLVVIGTPGFGRVRSAVLGSDSSHIVHGGQAPVLLVPPGSSLANDLQGPTSSSAAATP